MRGDVERRPTSPTAQAIELIVPLREPRVKDHPDPLSVVLDLEAAAVFVVAPGERLRPPVVSEGVALTQACYQNAVTILPAGDEGAADVGILEEAGAAEEADEIFEEEKEPEPVPAVEETMEPAPARMAQQYFEPEPDSSSSAYGRALFVPLLAMIFLAIVLGASSRNIVPALVQAVSGSAWGGYAMIWYIVAGLIVAFFLVIFIGGLFGGKKSKSKKGDGFQQPA